MMCSTLPFKEEYIFFSSEDENEVDYISEPITSLHQEEYSSLSKEELEVKSKEILLTLSRITQDQM